MTTRYHRYHCNTCGVDSESYSILTDNESLAFFREHGPGHTVTRITNAESPPFPPPAASAAMSNDLLAAIIFSNVTPDDIERHLGAVILPIPPGDEPMIIRIPPPAVFVVTHDDGVVHESGLEILAIFASQVEADAWLDTEHPGWRAPFSDYAVDRWVLGPPQKERDT